MSHVLPALFITICVTRCRVHPLSDTWGGKCQAVGLEARRVVPDANILRLLKLFLFGSNSVSEFTDLKIV